MIRRDPTMIPMTDNDVQEVRDVLAYRRTYSSIIKSDDQLEREGIIPGYLQQADAQKKREQMSQAERLGL